MQFAIAATLFATLALAAPTANTAVTDLEARQAIYIPCSGLYSNAQCCATDVLELADLDCAGPPTIPTNATEFQATCSDIGQRARCCAIPVLGQALLCQTPTGVEG